MLDLICSWLIFGAASKLPGTDNNAGGKEGFIILNEDLTDGGRKDDPSEFEPYRNDSPDDFDGGDGGIDW